MLIKNYTPHPVTVVYPDGTDQTIQPEGPVPRVTMIEEQAGTVAGMPTKIARPSRDVTNLPVREDGVILIVSRLVINAAPDRDDLYCAHDTVRNAEGVVVGCRSLAR